ncbi:unnamed protein product [Lampetra planeri]
MGPRQQAMKKDGGQPACDFLHRDSRQACYATVFKWYRAVVRARRPTFSLHHHAPGRGFFGKRETSSDSTCRRAQAKTSDVVANDVRALARPVKRIGEPFGTAVNTHVAQKA